MVEELEIAARMAIGLLFGALIGLERELHKHTAGLRTHMLVCMASSLLMVLSTETAKDLGVVGDPTRIAAGVMTGIGFLGAGTIIKHGATVQGLTTAASIWTAAAVGLAVGVGYYIASLIVVALTLFTLYLVHQVDERLALYRRRARLLVTAEVAPQVLMTLEAAFAELGISVGQFSVNLVERKGGRYVIDLHVKDMGSHERGDVAARLMSLEHVVGVDFY